MEFDTPGLASGEARTITSSRPVRFPLAAPRVNAPSERRYQRADRVRTSRDYARIKAGGVAFRGRHCILLAQRWPGEPTRVGFIASKKSVGGAVQRNRARRRLREIVRRRWPVVTPEGFGLVFIALRSALTAPHESLVAEVERLITDVGAARPAEP